ncbi:MAG: CsgG/HfaB family protein [bacterium]|nr:CsgG/HfaB family protein [bacterium]
MKKTIISILILSLFLAGRISAEDEKENKDKAEKPRIAVMDLEAKGVSTDEAEAVADFLRTDLINTEKFTVIERSRMQDIIKEQQMSLSGLTESQKAAKIGKILNCKFILVGTLSRLGSQYFLNVRAVDVETGETKLGKRESSNTVEEMSEVSKVIAAQLAGMKVEYRSTTSPSRGGLVATKEGGVVEPEQKFNNPQLGLDIQLGLSPKYNRIYTVNSTGDSWSENVEQSGTTSFLNLKIGAYAYLLYLGFTGKKMAIDKGATINVTYESNTGKSSGTSTYTVEAADWQANIQDLMIGIRFAKPGDLNYGVFYFAWRTLTYDNKDIAGVDTYTGPGFGVGGRIGLMGNKGCCGAGGGGTSPIGVFVDMDFNMAFIKYQPDVGVTTSDIPLTLSFGGELGFGIMFNRLGLYALINYNLQALVTAQTYSYTYTTSYGSYTSTYESTVTDIYHGSEIRVGWALDLQALFH